MKILVTGASGQVGQALIGGLPANVALRAVTHTQLDISDGAAVQAAVTAFGPDIVVNTAAYTAVDKAESEPDFAFAVNATGPRHLANAVREIPGCRLVQLSTDYVFDGRATEPYKPGDSTNPLSVYGRTKRAGEKAVLEALGKRAVVLRTAWVYASRGKNFLLTMLRLMREHGAVNVVTDQHGTPTAAASIVRAVWSVAQRPNVSGILHWTDAGSASWFEFAEAIAADGYAAGLLSNHVEVTPIATAQFPTPAPRPTNSVLDTRESIAQLGITPPPWRVNLRATLANMASS